MGRLILALLLLSPSLYAFDQIPARAFQYRHTVRAEVRRQWGLHLVQDAIPVLAGTIHQESSWNPLAQSPYAQGLTQFTKATWSFIIDVDPSIAALGDVWNPTAAIRAAAVYHKWLYVRAPQAKDELTHWAWVTGSYSGGLGNLKKDIQLCALDLHCDPLQWFGNVDAHSRRSAGAFAENRNYVSAVLLRWRPLYAAF